MKCKNCGANFSLREVSCPYCGTPNPRGKRWADRMSQAEQEYRQTRDQVKKELPIQVAYRVAGSVRTILAAILGVILLGMVLWALLSGYGGKFRNRVQRERLETQMAELYEQERFGELYRLMNDRELMGQDYYVYSQMCLIHYRYSEFCQARMELLQGGVQEDNLDFTIERILYRAGELLALDISAYPDLAPENQTVYDRYCLDVTTFLRTMLAMTEEEVLSLTGQGYVPTREGPNTVEPILETDYNWGRRAYLYHDSPLVAKIVAEEAWK